MTCISRIATKHFTDLKVGIDTERVLLELSFGVPEMPTKRADGTEATLIPSSIPRSAQHGISSSNTDRSATFMIRMRLD
jgi:hypothetical protein